MKVDGSEGSWIYLLYKSLILTQLDLFPLIKVKSFLQEKQWVVLHLSQLLNLFSHLMKIDGSEGSGIYFSYKSLILTQFFLFPLIKVKSSLQDKHSLLLHVSQLLYFFSHFIKLNGSKGSWIYVLFKSLFLTQLVLFPLIKVKPYLQERHWLLLQVSQLAYLFSHFIKIDVFNGSWIYVLFKSLILTQFNKSSSIKVKLILHEIQKLSLHFSQLLYLSSHFI